MIILMLLLLLVTVAVFVARQHLVAAGRFRAVIPYRPQHTRAVPWEIAVERWGDVQPMSGNRPVLSSQVLNYGVANLVDEEICGILKPQARQFSLPSGELRVFVLYLYTKQRFAADVLLPVFPEDDAMIHGALAECRIQIHVDSEGIIRVAPPLTALAYAR